MEIVYRAAITFFFLWLVTRALGKRELSELTAFELVLLVSIGDLVQQGVTQEDFSLTGSILAVGTIALLVLATSYVSFKWTRTRPYLEGRPVVLVHNGRVLEEAAHIERMTTEDIVEEARQHGIGDLARIRVGILEPDGKFSFLTDDKDKEEAPEHRIST